uniref:Remodeling and spacing factor 1 n=1 Tax=Anthurium amnicola TaxID=1678845 RepID=A0A1D1XRK5_9ARAE
MFERRRRGRPPIEKDADGREDIGDDEVVVLDSPPSGAELCRRHLRGRWELASVLNFLHVFQPIIQSELRISAEEMEMALVMPDEILARLHIALLKGIPPVSKNLIVSDAWVTVLCKKIKMWWPWVAEGEVPLVADHGGEILRYKELDPTARLLILKALCEIRVQQDDILGYIDEEVKHGGQLSKFRKDSIGGDSNGTTYWYDGDPVTGYRLYKNVAKVEFKQKLKGRGRLTQPVVNFQWETLATNFKEFQEISDKFSCSKVSSESAVGNIIKVDIMPAVGELEKKKEKALKRRQRQAMLLDGFKNCNLTRNRRACRDRKPVSYTFDEFDRSITEAIEEATITSKSFQHDSAENEIQMSIEEPDNDEKYWGGVDDDEDEDYDEKGDHECCPSYSDDDTQNNLGNSVKERDDFRRQSLLRSTVNEKAFRGKDAMRTSRASNGTVAHHMGQLEMKRRLRERPTRNTGYSMEVISDSEGADTSGEDLET